MDVKEAVKIAKAHAAAALEGETIRVEEVWFDEISSEWCITIGVQRPEPARLDIFGNGRTATSRMHYKTIRIDDATKAFKSLRNHEKMPVSPLMSPFATRPSAVA